MNVKERLLSASRNDIKDVIEMYGSSYNGLNDKMVDINLNSYGNNIIIKGKKDNIVIGVLKSLFDPFTIILVFIAFISLYTNVILVSNDKDPSTFIVIMIMVFISSILRVIQDLRSNKASNILMDKITTKVTVIRNNKELELDIDDIVVGDIVALSAGDIIPADIRLFNTKDFFINQATITGESEPIEKLEDISNKDNILDCCNLVFRGSNVISGFSNGIVIAVGNETMIGNISIELDNKQDNNLKDGINSISWLLIKFMIIIIPLVFIINGLSDGDWLSALLFSLSIAIGLTPEMLPMIVTTNLTLGSLSMAKEKTIVKNLNSIQNLGTIDILCSDKTGTLTEDNIVLEYSLDTLGKINIRVLRHGFINSFFQTGLKNLMDRSIINRMKKEDYDLYNNIINEYHKIDEIPFDFHRRMMSVIVQDTNDKVQMITKGAIEEILDVCKYVEIDSEVKLLEDNLKSEVLKRVNKLNYQGLRVLGVAQKTINNTSYKEEQMVLIGYLAFLDPIKDSSIKAIKALHNYGIETKILTGDNDKVALSVCHKVGISSSNILLGEDIEKMSKEELKTKIEKVSVFAKVSPNQKAQIIEILQELGHNVGFIGDGINDALAIKNSNVGISVDSAVDIAKESSDVILLDKDLMVLEKGILNGRKIYINMLKYIKMTISSNFGNIFSVIIASIFLPFLPMTPIQLILLNLVNDIACSTLPFDYVDDDSIKTPKHFNTKSITRFMLIIGPISSLFDILTFIFLYFILNCRTPSMIQTGWFLESLWTQILVIHTLRSKDIPFIETNAHISVILTSFISAITLTILTILPINRYFGLTSMSIRYYIYLVLIIILYITLTTIIKKKYINKYQEWI